MPMEKCELCGEEKEGSVRIVKLSKHYPRIERCAGHFICSDCQYKQKTMLVDEFQLKTRQQIYGAGGGD